MTEVPYSDPTSFIAACYVLVWGVVAAAVVLSLLELRHWAQRARELEAARREMGDEKETARDR